MKVAVLSHVLPPSSSGQALLIYRLLQERPPEDYCLLSQWDHGAGGGQEYSNRLPGRFRRVVSRHAVVRAQRFDAVKWLNLKLLGRQVATAAAAENCAAIVAFSGSPTDLPAGLEASRILKVPFYAYLCDYYSHQHTDAHSRVFAEKHEPAVVRGARGVIVPNEFLRDELRRRYGVEPVIVRNACDLGPYQSPPPPPDPGGERRIVYTGAVYEAHYDAFRNLVRAIEGFGRADVRLHLYTAQPPSELREAGIHGPVVIHGHATPDEMPATQRKADVLFLPLAFDSPYPEIIKTSAPFKTGEYLAARRPILVHAPRDSFLSWYFREHGCGVVVDEGDAERLAEGLGNLLDDVGLGERVCASAWERAREDFSISTAQSSFARLLGWDRVPER